MSKNNIGNILWSGLGLCIPAIIAIIFIPLLLENIGLERFGILSLAWSLIGYSSICDLGIGRATTLLVSDSLGKNENYKVKTIIKIACNKSIKYGFIFFIFSLICFIFFGKEIINAKGIEHYEIILSGLIISMTLPIQALSALYRGVSESFGEFKKISFVRFTIGILMFVLPYLISIFSNKIYLLIFTIFIARTLGLILFYFYANALIKDNKNIKLDRKSISIISNKLTSFGGWHTISSIISPILVQSDKLFISILISASAVSIYSIPYELTIKLTIIPGAVVSVAFPAIISLLTKSEHKAQLMFDKWVKAIAIGMSSIIFLYFIFINTIMHMWLKNNIIEQSIIIAKILSIGALSNSIALMYMTFLHAKTLANVVAKIHLIELPIYLGTLYFMCIKYGVIGVALTWSLRAFIDMLAMIYYKRKLCYI